MTATASFLIGSAVFLAVLMYIGWRGYRSTTDVPDYFVGKGAIGTFVLFWTIYATSFSAWTFLGMPGATFAHGLGWLILVPAAGAFGLTVLILGPRIHRWGKRFGYVTPPELFRDRYQNELLAMIIAVICVIGVVPYAAVQIMGIGFAVEGVTGGGIPFLGGTVFFILFLAVYTIFGGFKSVAWTDSLQGAVLFIFLWIALGRVLGSDDVGGISNLASALAAEDRSPLGLPGPAGYFTYTTWLSWFFLLIPGMVAYPWIIQRFFAARDVGSIHKTAALLPIIALLTAIPAVLIGLSAAHVMPDLAEPDLTMPTMLVTYAGLFFGTVLGLGAIAAAMSTIDSMLLSMGSIITRDVVARQRPDMSQALLLRVARVSVGAWVVVCLAIAVWRPTLIALLGAFDLQFIGLGLFMPLLAALFWRQSTAYGLIAGIVAGQAAGAIAAFVWKDPFGLGLDPVLWGYVVQIPVLVFVSLRTAPPPSEEIGRFFEEAVPPRAVDVTE